MRNKIVISFLILILLISIAYSQDAHGDRTNRSRNVHAGNLIRVTYWNHGMMGSIKGDNSIIYGGEWPINSSLVQMGNASSYIMAELNAFAGIDSISGDSTFTTITPAAFCQGWDPNIFSHDELGTFLGFEPLPGYFNVDNPEIYARSAMSHQPITWPRFWPDKLEDAVDPGWRGKWNGYFGKGQFNADQESYHVLDDYPFKKKIQGLDMPLPIPSEPDRGGIGLKKSIRGLQWSNPSAEDCIFWIYEIKNIGENQLKKTVFGLNVGASMGAVFGLNTDWMDDAATFYRDIGLTVNWDYDNIGTQGYSPVPWVGFAFLESPGNSIDGIDNDGDGFIAPGGGKLIQTSDFTRFVGVGESIVLIDYNTKDYKRTVAQMPPEGVKIQFGEMTYLKQPNTPLIEVPRNGVDDNLNGIIDEADGAEITETGETYYLYIQDPVYNRQSYLAKDYSTGEGLANLLIDERRDDGIDNDGDWDPRSDDVGLDGAEATGDQGEGNGLPTPGQGDLPGEPSVDRVDVAESDQIGLTSFIFYEYGSVTYSNDEQMWGVNLPGYFDGHLENVDADYIFSSGYFPLLPGQREAFSVGMVYGWNDADIIGNKKTVQDIYDANYNFALAPQLPTLTVVPGDGKVTLYWDDKAEESKDRYLNDYDFEGYKIYRATDPGFKDAMTNVIDEQLGAYNIKTPLAVFDKIDGVYGFFQKAYSSGVQYYLGSESGLVHTYVDSPVVNGRRYYYAVTAYDKGSLKDNILPSETSKYVAIDAAGKIQEKGKNVAVVVPAAPVVGYVPPEFDIQPQHVGPSKVGSGLVRCRFLEPDSIKEGRKYELQFLDNASDGIDNDGDKNIDVADRDELIPLETTGFILKDITNGTTPIDTVIFKDYRWIDTTWTIIKNLYEDSDKENSSLRAISHGIEFYIMNPPAAPGVVNVEDEYGQGIRNGIKWSQNIDPNFTYLLDFGRWESTIYKNGIFYPRQFKMVFYDNIVDTSTAAALGLRKFTTTIKIPAKPSNFKIFDILSGKEVNYAFRENRKTGPTPAGFFSAKDEVWILETLPTDTTIISFYLLNNSADDSLDFYQYYHHYLGEGDTLYLYPDFQFTSANRFQFSTKAQKLDVTAAKAGIDQIRVVPNPYVAAAAWEPTNPFRSGRGPRKIQFINLPSKCTIRIFAVDGTLVKTLEHDAMLTNGAEEWDLLTKDNMDVAYGLYIYHVDAPDIGQHVGRFIVIK